MHPMRTGCAVLAGLLSLWLVRPAAPALAADEAEPAPEGVCTLLTDAEVGDALGQAAHIAPDLTFYPTSMACSWSAAAMEDGTASLFVVPGSDLEAPTDSDTYKALDGFGEQAFVDGHEGSWTAGAIVAGHALKLQADGPGLAEAAATGLLKLAEDRVPGLVAQKAAQQIAQQADSEAAAPAGSETKEPTVCERLPASEMSALLGVEVVAESKDRGYKSTCTYTQEGTFLFVEVEFEPGAGAAGMEGAGMAAQSQPGVADPLSGLGDQAVMAGPMLMIRKGEDLLTLTFSGVEGDWATLAGQILERGHWPETKVAAGEGKGGETPADPLARLQGSLGGIPGANELLKAFGAPSGATPPEPPPASVAAVFDQPAVLDEPCPPGGPSAAGEIAAEAAALVPMKTGMTLSYIWTYEGDQYDHECLVQVSEIGADGVTTRSTCPVGPEHTVTASDRQVCRSDLRDGLTRETKFSPGMPVIIAGATYITLSRAAFHALKDDGTTWHRYQEVWAPEDNSSFDVRGPIERTGAGTVSIIVNDKLVELPVIFAKGTLTAEPYDGKDYPFTLTVLDDANVPIVLDYVMTGTRFRINYTKITYPAGPALEEQLATDEPVAMYGIYFDFNSDTLLQESKPMLDEIAAVMQAHPDWRLGVDGHTDSVGGDDFNLDLSKRRAAAVKAALAADYGIDPDRLETDGHGASQPRETNDTPKGRALNRRVELRRL